jgi:hypothetical protein
VSQTCDVVALTADQEPFVEVLHCHARQGVRSQFARLRSTRRIDFYPNRDAHPDLVLTAHATADRYYLPRELLVGFRPDEHRRLDATATQRLLAWQALRASRPAWPDNFVSRIKPVNDKLEASLSELSDTVEVRVALLQRDQELPAGESYRLALFFVVDGVAWRKSADVRANAYSAYGEFVSALADCNGVEVDEVNSGVVSGEEFTWQQTRSTDEWNYANLSFTV